MVKSLNTIQHFCKSFCGKAAEGELHHRCIMELVLVLPKHNYLCSIMPAKLLDFSVSTCFSLVGNLAQNSTRLSLSNESFFVNKIMCFPVFMKCLHFVAVSCKNSLSITFKHETIAPRIFWCVSLFSQNYAWSHMFTHVHKDFLGIQSLVQKQKLFWCLFKQKKFWKFKWFLRKVTILRENLKKKKKNKQKDKAPWSDSKSWVLFEWIMRNHVACSHESKAYRSLMHAFEMKKGHLW